MNRRSFLQALGAAACALTLSLKPLEPEIEQNTWTWNNEPAPDLTIEGIEKALDEFQKMMERPEAPKIIVTPNQWYARRNLGGHDIHEMPGYLKPGQDWFLIQ
jgi:hypothetical protein